MEIWDQLVPFACVHALALGTLGILVVVLFLYWYGTNNERLMRKLNVPGPKPRMFVGSVPDIKKFGGIHLMLLHYMREYGKVFAICIGNKPSLVVSDPEMLKQIMVKDFASFRNRLNPIKPRPPLDMNVLNARDDIWKRIRTTLTPSFTAAKMKQMLPLIEGSCDTLIKKMEEIADTGMSVIISVWDFACFASIVIIIIYLFSFLIIYLFFTFFHCSKKLRDRWFA